LGQDKIVTKTFSMKLRLKLRVAQHFETKPLSDQKCSRSKLILMGFLISKTKILFIKLLWS